MKRGTTLHARAAVLRRQEKQRGLTDGTTNSLVGINRRHIPCHRDYDKYTGFAEMR